MLAFQLILVFVTFASLGISVIVIVVLAAILLLLLFLFSGGLGGLRCHSSLLLLLVLVAPGVKNAIKPLHNKVKYEVLLDHPIDFLNVKSGRDLLVVVVVSFANHGKAVQLLEVEQSLDDLVVVLAGRGGLLLQWVAYEHQVLEHWQFREVLELAPFPDVVVRHVQNFEPLQAPDRLEAVDLVIRNP